MSSKHQVIVVGGGLVGLSAAMFLAGKGVSVVVVEQHASSSLHPRAIGFTPRTLELFRSCGLSGPLGPIKEISGQHRPRRTQVESLSGKWLGESLWTPEQKEKEKEKELAMAKARENEKRPSSNDLSPHTGAAIAQDVMEPLIRSKAIEVGADVRQSTQMLKFEQDAEGVTVWVKNRVSGEEYTLRALYMIAADGHRSKVREDLKIGMTGTGYMKTLRSVLFRAELQEYLKSGIVQFEIRQPDLEAFLTTYNDGRWVLMLEDKDRTEEEYRECIYKAIGRRDLAVDIITTGCWELSARIADSYTKDRIFLAGDAAHTLPPSRGGYGANTGIEDVHNLAWKLHSVLTGKSSPSLLSTYDAERRPIGWLRHNQIFARPDYKHMAVAGQKEEKIIEDDAMELGQLYRSEAVIGAGDDLPPALRPDQWAGQPGTRAPHLHISVKGTELQDKLPKTITQPSILDLYQHWVFLSENPLWKDAAKGAETQLGVEARFVQVGKDIEIAGKTEDFRKYYGIDEDGVVLVRPDGYIAWKQQGKQGEIDTTHAVAALRKVALISS